MGQVVTPQPSLDFTKVAVSDEKDNAVQSLPENVSSDVFVLSLLSSNPTPLDELIRLTGYTESQLISIISILELEGHIHREVSGFVKLL